MGVAEACRAVVGQVTSGFLLVTLGFGSGIVG